MVGSGSRLKRSVRATLKPSSPGGIGASAVRSMRRSAAMWTKGLDDSGRNFRAALGLGAVVTPTSAKRTGWPASQRTPLGALVLFRAAHAGPPRHRRGHRAGAHGVPADLEHRAPAHRPR